MTRPPETLADMLDEQYAARRAFDRNLFGDLAPADSEEVPSPETGPPAGEVAEDRLTPEERALLEDRAASGDATALALLEEVDDAEAGPQSGDFGAKKGGRLKSTPGTQFNEIVRRSFGGRR